MSQIIVAYWSGTGNTEAMAQAIGKGITEAGGEARVVSMEEPLTCVLCPTKVMIR